MDSGLVITSLFQQQPRARRGVSAYAISMTLHGAGLALVTYALLHFPMVRERPVGSHYAVRELKLHMPDRAPTGNEKLYPHPGRNPTSDSSAQAPGPALQPRPSPGTPQPTTQDDSVLVPNLPRDGGMGKQILLQPKLHIHQELADTIPVPMVIMWMPELNQTKIIVPAKPDAPTTADAPPSLVEPNEELDTTAVSLSAAQAQPTVPTPPSGTTSPLAQKGHDLVKLPPTTETDSTDQPTPTAVLSVSDVRMPNGVAVLPPVNETRSGVGTDGAGARPANGQGFVVVQPGGGSNGTGGGGTGTGSGVSVVGSGSGTAAQEAATESVDHIQLPQNGHFGVVVVGASPTAQDHEAPELWNDRMAYTVYLHVGLPQTWILQYGQLQAEQGNGTGAVSHLDAPWPYDIFRPNFIAADLNADALMVHGILSASGKLESLAVAFPADFPHASFVVNALSRWQFRPASQNGKPIAVEILLIIPEDSD